jgi:hypothetical protein
LFCHIVEEDIADLPAIDDRTMLKKDDPDFSPMIKKKEKKTKAKENVTPEEASGRRPRRYKTLFFHIDRF